MAADLDPNDDKPQKNSKARQRHHLEFIGVNIANLLILTGSVMFVLLPAYLQDNGMTRSQIGLVDGSFWLISVFVQPWLGIRLDRDGRKLYLILGATLMALAALCYPYIPIDLAPMLLARVVHGFGFACYLTASWAWVADTAPPKKLAEYFGIFGVSSMIAGAIGPGFAKQVVIHKGYTSLFSLGSLIIFLGVLLLPFISNKKPHLKAHVEQSGFFKILASLKMRGPALGGIAFGLAVGSIFAFIAPYLASLEINGLGPIFVSTALASGASRIYAGRQNHLGPARMITPSLVCLALGCAGLALVSYFPTYSIILLIASGLAAGIGYGIIYPALNAVAIERLNSATRGQGLALVTASIDSGSFIGAVLAGEVMHRAGYPSGFFAIAFLLLTLAIVFSQVERHIKFDEPAIKLGQPLIISKRELN